MLEEPVGCCNRSRSTSFPRNCPSPSGRNFALDPSTNWLISVKHCRCQLEAMNETCTVLDKKGPVPLKGRCLLLFLLMSFSVDGSGEKRPKRQTPSLRSRGCRPRISFIFPPPNTSSQLNPADCHGNNKALMVATWTKVTRHSRRRNGGMQQLLSLQSIGQSPTWPLDGLINESRFLADC